MNPRRRIVRLTDVVRGGGEAVPGSGSAQAAPDVTAYPAGTPDNPPGPDPFTLRDETARLIERWRAPVLPEEAIDALAALYRMTPKAGMSFVEFLIVRGVAG